MSLDKTFTGTNWPEESEDMKVVQLSIDGNPCLRFPTKEYREGSHGAILTVTLMKNGVPYEKIVGRSEVRIPALIGVGYKVHGMGKAKIDVGQRLAHFYGSSYDYGIGINTEHLECIRSLHPDWKIEVQ